MQPNIFVSMHNHLVYCDGAANLEQFLQICNLQKVEKAALTCHDWYEYLLLENILGWNKDKPTKDRLRRGRQGVYKWHQLEIWTGAEWTANFEGRNVHLLMLLNKDPPKKVLDYLQRLAKHRSERLSWMTEKFNGYAQKVEGLEIELDFDKDVAPLIKAVGTRTHLAIAIAKKLCKLEGYEEMTPKQVMKRWLIPGKAYVSVDKRFIKDYQEVIALGYELDGFVGPAHPIELEQKGFNLEHTMQKFVEAGANLIETHNERNDEKHTSKYLDLAKRLRIRVPPGFKDYYGHIHGKGLFRVGGNDWHGKNKPEVSSIGLYFPQKYVSDLELAHIELLKRKGLL